jgi:glycosyltransferase involved in cell wall biosynthesis
LVVSPTDEKAFLVAAKRLRSDASLRSDSGARARSYAEATFDTATVTDRFEQIIDRAVGRAGAVPALGGERA